MGEATAAAVAGGSKVSAKFDRVGGAGPTASLRQRQTGGIGAGAGVGGGGGGMGGGNVRVTGRDQSQTLGELLIFVLETFPRFFLGMVAATQVVGVSAGLGANNCAPPPMNFDAGKAQEGDVAQYQEWTGAETAADVGGGEFPPKSDESSTGEGREWTPSLVFAEPASPPSVSSRGLSYDGSSSSDNTGVDRAAYDSGGSASARARLSGATADVGVDIDGEGFAGSHSPGGASSAVSENPGGEPATAAEVMMMSPTDRCPPEWPQLCSSSGSPLPSRSPPPSSSPSSNALGESETLVFSPAGAATTTGLRELEEEMVSLGERGQGGDGRSRGGEVGRQLGVWGGNSGFGGFGGGFGDDGGSDGVWRQGMGGEIGGRRLAWGPSPGKSDSASSVAAVAPTTSAGPARALRFTSPDDGEELFDGHRTAGDTAAAAAAAEGRTVDNGMGGRTGGEGETMSESSSTVMASAASANYAVAIDHDGPSHRDSDAAGAAFDEWASMASTAADATDVLSSPPAPAMSSALGGETVTMPAGPQQAESAPLTAVATAGAGEGVGGVDSMAAGLPGVALKEAARSLCNLYACHGAPAAGGEAAGGADLPERLQPLAAAGTALCQLWPPASAILLRRLLGTWPTGSSRREVAYLRLIAGVACAAPPVEVMCPGSRIPLMLFRRVSKCINSPNTKVGNVPLYVVCVCVMYACGYFGGWGEG